ncbi:MAG TPA: ATP-binding protein [Gemmatimonadaceae bacterium]|nr:ATP-binding protein [Gemmatimonadaceae bacterium]
MRAITALWRRVRRARLTVQLAVLAATVAALAVLTTFTALSGAVRSRTTQLIADELGRNQRVLLLLQRRTLEQSLLTASLLTKSPTLRAAIETYRDEGGHSGAPRQELRATLQRELDNLREGSGSDLLLVTDDAGRLLASSTVRPLPPSMRALAAVPMIHHALDAEAAVDSASLGVLEVGGAWYQAAAVPIVLDGYVIGALVTGHALDDGSLGALARLFDGELVVGTPAAIIATTIPRERAASIVAPGAARRAGYLSAVLPLGLTSRGDAAQLHLLYALAPTERSVSRTLLVNFALWGGAAVLLVGLGTILVSRSVLKPLHRVVDVMRSPAPIAAAERQIAAGDEALEVRSLGESYNELIRSLAAERSALEERGAELAESNRVLTQQILERERAERTLRERDEQLRQSQKLEAIGTLAGGVAHDFNNLLTVISGFTQLALAQTGRGVSVAEDLKQVAGAADRASHLTRQLLAFGRKQVLQPRVLDLAEVVAGVEPMLRRLIGEHIELRTAHASPLARVHADPGQLEQVIVNLVVNARDAMPTGGTMTISTENGAGADTGKVRLLVRDTGTGMSAATQARIFEPFFTTKEPGKGTGLGLATVYGIVTQSGGRIDVDSVPGRGTQFAIVLPASDPSAARSKRDEPTGPAPRGSETILLVEDEETLRILTERALRDQGYVVLSAENGAAALDRARTMPGAIDLLVTDVVMPAMSGPMLVTRLASLQPTIRVLYVSGYADDTIASYRLDPTSAFLAKPFTPVSLAWKVREVLDAAP